MLQEEISLKEGVYEIGAISSSRLCIGTLENNCTREVQSSRDGCSRRVLKIVYLAVKMSNILVYIIRLTIFIANHCHFKSSCVTA